MRSEKPNRDRLLQWTVINFALLAVLWILQNFVAERWWLTVWLVYVPTHWIVLPSGVLWMWSLVRRRRLFLLLNTAAIVMWLLAFMGFNVPLRRASTPDETSIRLLTYNIRYGSGGADELARTIHATQPDVVCLQETRAFRGWPDPIPALQPHFRGWHMRRAGEVTTFSRFPISAAQEYSVPTPSNRKILETVIDVGDSQTLTIFNTHISTGSTVRPSREQVRRYAIEAAKVRREEVEFLLQSAASTTGPHVLMGDFNNPPRGLLYRDIARRYTDTFNAAGWGLGFTFHAALPVLRIDYIWASRDLRVLSSKVIGQTVSDHWPLLSVVDLASEK